MKKLIFLIIAFFQTITYSQTQIDNNVSVKFPGKNEILEENAKGFSSKSFFLNTPDDAFFITRLEGSTTQIPLPDTEVELKKYYQTLSNESIKNLEKKGYIKSSEKLITLKDYTAYQIEFSDNSKKEKNGECLVLLVNHIAYLFIYVKIGKYSEDRKNTFVSSIDIQKDLNQFEDNKYLKPVLKILFSILLIIFIRIYFKRNNQSKASS